MIITITQHEDTSYSVTVEKDGGAESHPKLTLIELLKDLLNILG